MLVLRLPLDVERLPEFRQLVSNISAKANPTLKLPPKQIEAMAMFLFMRLMVELGYLAQKTNKPGLLTKWGVDEYRRTVNNFFGEECDVMQMLTEGPPEVVLLRKVEDAKHSTSNIQHSTSNAEGGSEEFFCGLFSGLNVHLAGDFQTKEERGNESSKVSRRQDRLRVESVQQAGLFGDTFVNLAGQPLVGKDLNNAIIVVRNIDVSVSPTAPARHQRSYTQGLMTDALKAIAHAGDKHDGKALFKFYAWLSVNQHNATVPKSAEKILEEFEVYYKAAGL